MRSSLNPPAEQKAAKQPTAICFAHNLHLNILNIKWGVNRKTSAGGKLYEPFHENEVKCLGRLTK